MPMADGQQLAAVRRLGHWKKDASSGNIVGTSRDL
jgi:hypothetical protein